MGEIRLREVKLFHANYLTSERHACLECIRYIAFSGPWCLAVSSTWNSLPVDLSDSLSHLALQLNP